jgi:hypothetical protein
MAGLVITGGRVVDPASGMDAIGDVAVLDGRIAAVADTDRIRCRDRRPVERRDPQDHGGMHRSWGEVKEPVWPRRSLPKLHGCLFVAQCGRSHDIGMEANPTRAFCRCPLSGEDRKTSARIELFRVW